MLENCVNEVNPLNSQYVLENCVCVVQLGRLKLVRLLFGPKDFFTSINLAQLKLDGPNFIIG